MPVYCASATVGYCGGPTDPYSAILGPAWAEAPEVLRKVHTAGRSRGFARIEHGSHVLARLIGRLGRLPPAAPTVPIELNIIPCGGWIIWRRRMGRLPLVTRQTERAGRLVERYGSFELTYNVQFDGTTLLHEQVDAAFVLGRCLRVRLPSWLAPHVAAMARAQHDAVSFHVEVSAPIVGRILLYEGSVTPETDE